MRGAGWRVERGAKSGEWGGEGQERDGRERGKERREGDYDG